MRRKAILITMITCCFTAVFSAPVGKKNTISSSAVKLCNAPPLLTHSKNPVHKTKKTSNISISLTISSALSNYVIEFNGASGTYQYAFTNTTLSIPYGTYTVGIHKAGGTTANQTFSGSACTNSYNVTSTSATFLSVPLTCSNAYFSVN